MDIKEFLTEVVGEEKAEKYLKRTKLAQSSLQEAEVESKESTAEKVEAETTEQPEFNIDEVIAKVGDEYDMEGLSKFVEEARETQEKVEVLTALVKELSKTKEEQVAEMISGTSGKRFAWSQKQDSNSDETVVEDDDELLNQGPTAPKGWLSEFSGTEPVPTPN